MKMLKWIGGLWRFGVVAILAGLAGAFLAAMFMPGMATPSGWADVMTAMFTFFALIVAVSAFFTWKKSKIRDDGYEAAKEYVASLVDLEVVFIKASNPIYKLNFKINERAPTEVEVRESIVSLSEIVGLMNVTMQIIRVRRGEIGFWSVGLSEEMQEIHDRTIDFSKKYVSFVELFCDCAERYYSTGSFEDGRLLDELCMRIGSVSYDLRELFEKRRRSNMSGIYL